METSNILHKKFVELGRARNRLTYKLLDLLPKIYEKEIYKEYAATIYEYAGKYAGLPKSVVEKRLNLEKHLKDKPCLRAAIRNVGVHKVALVAGIATPETDKVLAGNVKNMSKPAIQELSKELRYKINSGTMDKTMELPTLCKAVDDNIKIELSGETKFMFLKLKKKLGGNISNKEAIKIMLKKLNDIESNTREAKTNKPNLNNTINRHIPAGKKRETLITTHEKCSYPGCNNPYEIIHHIVRFMEGKNHEMLKPLCKIHHEFMHNGIVKNEKDFPDEWLMLLDGKLENEADRLYRKYRTYASIAPPT